MLRFRRPWIRRPAFSQVLDYSGWTLFLSILLAVLYRYGVLDIGDPYGCGALLNRGRWLDPLTYTHRTQPFQNWQPPGCMLHQYDAKDISTCLRFQKIVFVGDSTTRNVFWATARKLDKTRAVEKMRTAEKHADLNFSKAHVTLNFHWDPFLNSSKLQEQLNFHRIGGDAKRITAQGNMSAAILMVGGGLWHARHIESAALKNFKVSIGNVMASTTLGGPGVLGTSTPQAYQLRPNSNDLLVIAPVQNPLYGFLDPSLETKATMITASIDPLNDYLQQITRHEGAPVAWSYELMTRQEKAVYDKGGIHVIEAVARQKADILLNMRCNTEIPGYPMDKTCCNRYPKPNWVQTAIIVCTLVLVLVILFWSHYPKWLFFLPPPKISRAVLVFALALCYSFCADRTHLFNKSQKQFSMAEFRALSFSVLALGVLSIRRSIPKKGQHSISNDPLDQPFLSRDQTDEWKGWMQFAILIYHYTGASNILEIYRFIRILVASYLFMTGFGHTIFFYEKGDYSLRRFASVLMRLNLLSCLLPFMMGTDYLFYYFAPLISFWYVVIYLTMCIGCSKNTSIRFLLGKIMVSGCFTTALIRTPGLFEALFWILKRTCHVKWNVAEWRFRLQLDSYIVYVGMICGILFVRISSTLCRDGLSESSTSRFLQRHWTRVRLGAITASLITPPLFWRLTRHFSDKFAYNALVPYISSFPILAFIVLRNYSRYTRNFHSTIFAWLGRHSLETFTLQFHIWLAADTKGLLALGVFGRHASHIDGRWPDFAVLTVVFLWVCWHVAAATGTVTAWIIDPSTGRAEGEINEANGAALELPRAKSSFHRNGHVKEAAPVLARPARAVGRLMKGDLRFRLTVLLGALWVLNMTYR